MSINDYPARVEEVLDDQVKFRPAVLRAVRAFARAKPWRGALEERQAKFRSLNAALAAAYNRPVPQVVFGGNGAGDSGGSCCVPRLNAIILKGRLSVVTFLHEWAHQVYGRSERQACRFSLNLFRRCFPRSWKRLTWEGHMVRANRDLGGSMP